MGSDRVARIGRGKPAFRGTLGELLSKSGLMTVCVVLAGCGAAEPDRAHVSGKVTYQGKPVDFGDIVFVPSGASATKWKGFYCQGGITNGHYAIVAHGPVVGRNRVEIYGYKRTGQKMPDIAGKNLAETPKVVEVLVPNIPPRYNLASEMNVEIQPGRNDGIDFEL